LIWKSPLRCKEHATEEMMDVMHKLCTHAGCTTRPNYGPLWGSPTHCAAHKEAHEMYYRKPKCAECTEFASHAAAPDGAPDGAPRIPTHCQAHSTDEMKDILHIACDVCMELHTPDKITVVRDSNRCDACKHKWNNNQVHEYNVEDYVLKGNFTYIHNKVVQPGVEAPGEHKACSSSGTRPDFVVDVNPLFKTIIEVDENQHSGYRKLCATSIHKELARMITVHENDFGGSPTIFIRFNPDKYKTEGRHASIEHRLKTLKRLLEQLRNKRAMKSQLSCYYLYYDNYKRIKESPIKYRIDGSIIAKHAHPKSEETEFIIPLTAPNE
jgi:hypothetical protein